MNIRVWITDMNTGEENEIFGHACHTEEDAKNYSSMLSHWGILNRIEVTTDGIQTT